MNSIKLTDKQKEYGKAVVKTVAFVAVLCAAGYAINYFSLRGAMKGALSVANAL